MSNNTQIVRVFKRVGDLDMGVFDDGSTYLSESSLASMCGVHRTTIAEHAESWENGDRDSRLAKFLTSLGFAEASMAVTIAVNGGAVAAYPEQVCMAVLEYYAFLANKTTAKALSNYRMLARASLRLFIYQNTGYDPNRQVSPGWQNYIDRLHINSVPPGFFSVHRELADLVLFAIQHGLIVDDRTIPDGSAGTHWGKKWERDGLDEKHGPRRKFDHVYPDSHRQAAAGVLDVWVYPVAALGEFRLWLQFDYIPNHFPDYLKRKIKQNILTPSVAELILGKLEEYTELEPKPVPPKLGPKK